MRLRPLSEEAYLRVIRTARRQTPASLWLAGGNVLNVFTKEWQTLNVVLAGERIAYVGEKEPLFDEQTVRIDASDFYLVPGYIEPHAHPFQWYNPETLSNFALLTGTTTLISDTLVLAGLLPYEEVADIMEKLSNHPVKQLFWARLDPQIQQQNTHAAYTKEGLDKILSHPLVIQGGELTDWPGLLAEDETILYGLKRVRDLGKRMEGHHPGASAETLNIASAAGITACHESMTAEDVIQRLSLGMHVSLRHSSIRPDLPVLVQGLLQSGVPWSSRMMLTSDGSTPPMMRHGFMDYTIRVAIESGVPPVEAYVMATLNPAAYYGLDAEVGGIAPGRIADILLLRNVEEPTPELVIANGRPVAKEGKPVDQPVAAVNWRSYDFPKINQMLDYVNSSWFRMRHPGNELPVIQMANAVITRMGMEQLPSDREGYVSLAHDPELALIVLYDPRGKRFTQAIVRGYGSELEGLASTYTASADWLIIGRDAEAMTQALEHVIRIEGGVVLVDRGEVAFELPLPLAGKLTELPVEDVISKAEEFTQRLRQKGYAHLDPIYSLLFFTATHLPYIRLTAEGLYNVKERRVIYPSIT